MSLFWYCFFVFLSVFFSFYFCFHSWWIKMFKCSNVSTQKSRYLCSVKNIFQPNFLVYTVHIYSSLFSRISEIKRFSYWDILFCLTLYSVKTSQCSIVNCPKTEFVGGGVALGGLATPPSKRPSTCIVRMYAKCTSFL